MRYLELDGIEPLRTGDVRQIYALPDYPFSLLKIVRREKVDETGNFIGKSAIKRLRPEGCYQGFAREVREYVIQSRKHYHEPFFKLPIAHIHGFVQTDHGVGLLTEKIVGDDGDLAPTLGHLHSQGLLGEKHKTALDSMFRRCRDLHIVLNDIHANNIVYTEHRTGAPECVCVDGFGERVFIPLQRWIKRLNSRKIDDIARKAAVSLQGTPRFERWGRG